MPSGNFGEHALQLLHVAVVADDCLSAIGSAQEGFAGQLQGGGVGFHLCIACHYIAVFIGNRILTALFMDEKEALCTVIEPEGTGGRVRPERGKGVWSILEMVLLQGFRSGQFPVHAFVNLMDEWDKYLPQKST